MTNKMLVLLLLLLGTAATGFTQSKLTEEQKKEFKEKQEAYKAKLNLTEDQATKMEAINMTYLEGLSALKQSSGSKLSKYKKFKSLNNERDAQAKKILTEEQYKLFKQQQKEMKEDFKEQRSKG
ncbi:hypothetical protein D3H65_04555 [Paraflavitalea soli]|uniref:DUF4890 domain-containing protein n=1 Tax=Paraflavitalea soli TaxID=2315862 RepID=A0A3B7MJ21_9BACT|nr:hypothetical protein [Paraflavitalea soli]AXY73293.1 hypothetical protein D3H65_04555 [Paraflavitalea soli]